MKAPTYNNETRYMEDIHAYQAFGLVELVMKTLIDDATEDFRCVACGEDNITWRGAEYDNLDTEKFKRMLFLKFKEALTRSYWDIPDESN